MLVKQLLSILHFIGGFYHKVEWKAAPFGWIFCWTSKILYFYLPRTVAVFTKLFMHLALFHILLCFCVKATQLFVTSPLFITFVHIYSWKCVVFKEPPLLFSFLGLIKKGKHKSSPKRGWIDFFSATEKQLKSAFVVLPILKNISWFFINFSQSYEEPLWQSCRLCRSARSNEKKKIRHKPENHSAHFYWTPWGQATVF